MGYFSNGTEGMAYEEQWCSRCAHYGVDGCGCAVLNAHMCLNYDECNNKSSVLHLLIPRTENGLGNERCRMFLKEKA